MKTKLLIPVCLLIAGCSGPKALVTYESGDKILVKKLKSDGDPLLFRRDGSLTTVNLKKIGKVTIPDTAFQVYEGDSWQKVVITYNKDEAKTAYTGWLKSGAALTGVCPAGDCNLRIASLAEIDFIMEETAEATPAPTDTAAAGE